LAARQDRSSSVEIAGAPAVVHAHIAADGPPTFLKPLRERRNVQIDTRGAIILATAEEDRLSFKRYSQPVICGSQRLPNNRDL